MKRQRIRDIVRNPDNEELLSETYDNLERELYSKIDAYKSQVLMCEDKSDNIRKLEQTTASVSEMFDNLMTKNELSEGDLKNIVDKIFIYESHIEITLKADIERLLVNSYAIEGRDINIERIADEFFREEIVQKAAHHSSKRYDVCLKKNTPLFYNVVSDDEAKSINVIKEGDPSLITLTQKEKFIMELDHIAKRMGVE